MLAAYAVGILVFGVLIAALGLGGAAFSATAADVLAEKISPTMNHDEVRRATYDFLETQRWRRSVALVVVGFVVSIASIPLFLADTQTR
jgi:hypothetical protein